MGPITQAMDAMLRAEIAFREHGLLRADECVICGRMLDQGGNHTSDCAVLGLHNAKRRLQEFATEVAG